MVLASRLTEKLILTEVAISASTIGEPIETYTDYKTIYASIITQNGTGAFNTGLPGNTYTDNINFYCRYFTLPESVKKYRVKYKDELYRIRNLTPVQRKAIIMDLEHVK